MNWVGQLFSRRRVYRDLSEEIREHLEEKIEELLVSGVSREEAVAAAHRLRVFSRMFAMVSGKRIA
jgi:hypothetical protein